MKGPFYWGRAAYIRSMEGIEEITFVCPECAERIEVNAAMREALVEYGCVVCGAEISAEEFAR